MTRKIRVAVVDDHAVVRRGIVETYADADDFEVMAEGANVADAMRIVEGQSPDILLLDVSMPGGSGLDAVAQISKARPEVRIVMLSIREDLTTVRTALRAGAKGYLSKGIDGAELLAASRKVFNGSNHVSPDLAAQLLALDSPPQGAPTADPAGVGSIPASLSRREDQIFRLLGEGLSNIEIGDRLGLTENTVKHYITPLLHKLGARNRTEAALMATGRMDVAVDASNRKKM